MPPKILISLAILLQCLSLKGQYPPELPPTPEFLQIQEYKKKIDSLSEIIFKRALDTLVPLPERYHAVREAAFTNTDKSITFLLENEDYIMPTQEEYKILGGLESALSVQAFYYSASYGDGWRVLSKVLYLMKQKKVEDRILNDYLAIIAYSIKSRRYAPDPNLKPIFELELAMTPPPTYDPDIKKKIYRENLLRMIALCR
jgi:hypothetical protein